MPKKKYDNNPLLVPLVLIGQILIAIGTPVLVIIKFFIYFTTLLGEKVISTGEIGVKKATSKKTRLSKVKSQPLKKFDTQTFPSFFKTIQNSWEDTKSAVFIKFKQFEGNFLPKIESKWQRFSLSLVKRNKLAILNIKSPSKKTRLSISKKPNPKRELSLILLLKRIHFPKIKLKKTNPLSKVSTTFHLPAFATKSINLPKIRFHFPSPPRIMKAAIAGISAGIIVFLIFYSTFFVFKDLPHPRLLALKIVPLTTKIYDRNGILLYQFYDDENRTLVKLTDLPPYVPQAVIAAEDKNFYKHIGFDPAGITRAAIANYSGEDTQGGSTITQQLVKLSLLNSERTITRKIRETILSVWAERLYTKDQILTMYLNYIGFGGPAYGIEAASEIYFGKSAKNLSLSEAALLASLPSSPTTYSPFGTQPEIAKYRQIQVLDKMAEEGYITKQQADSAKREQLTFVPNETEIKAPHFVMYVRDQLIKEYGEKTVLEGGLQVKTTLDYDLYKKATEQVKNGVDKQQYLNVQNGAALITNPKTGEILSMTGSTDFFALTKDGNVNVTVSVRSPGSSIKPLTYALGFEKNLITPNTIIDDSPTSFRQIGGPVYRPINYDNRFHGRVSARTALASSYNIPAVKVLEKIGLVDFLQFAQNAGLTTLNDPNRFGLALTLGGGEVKMTDMAEAYSMFPNDGKKVPLKSILEVKDASGNILETSNPYLSSNQIITPKSAFYINSILSDDQARAPTFGTGSYLNIPGHTVAVKTGTAETKRDNWTIGYSFGPDPRLVAVWVGNNDNSPMSQALESGNTGAAAIWNPLMQEVLKDKQNFAVPRPDNLVPVQICPLTGTLPCENCPFTVTEYFQRGTEPKENCNLSKEDLEKIRLSNTKN